MPREVPSGLNVPGMRVEEEEEPVDEGLALWTEEYPELLSSVVKEKDSSSSLHTSFSPSEKLSSSLDMALQCSSLSPASASEGSLMDIMEAVNRKVSRA